MKLDPSTIIKSMTDALVHRGPDDEGHWISNDGKLALGQRRLAIIDLSPAGHQPMVSPGGRYVITFNGEIYNYREIRKELESRGQAPVWRGHSDTEVLLAAIEAWGLEAALERTAGMFAIALWDQKERSLTLARDRFGEKPLYYGNTREGFAFASELKAIRTLPGFSPEIDGKALRCLLAVDYIPAPLSIYRGIAKLKPGHLVRPVHGGAIVRNAPQICWYDYAKVVAKGQSDTFRTAAEALAELGPALETAVGRQMVADVPVGAFLSGGVDSSLIAALASRQSLGKLKTFSIGFEDAAYDEAPYAKAVAKHLGTDHHELYISARDVRDVIPKLPDMYDEPFGDSSQIPTHLVSKFARQHVTVSLSGDAGDEMFGGYNRYRALPPLWQKLAKVPKSLRSPLLGGAAAIGPGFWNGAARLATGQKRPEFFGRKIKRTLAVAAASAEFGDLFFNFLDSWHGYASPLANEEGGWQDFLPKIRSDPNRTLVSQLMEADSLDYLPGDILTKVDRAAMSVSLESRVPLLDPDLVAIAARISADMNIAGGRGKLLLREILYKQVPANLIERPKAGFAIPIGDWLKGPLREWAEDLLSQEALNADGLFDSATIRSRWHGHLLGQEDATKPLWTVLMFQAWKRATFS